MARSIFGCLKKVPKQGYEINPQTLTVNVEYEKVQMNYDFGNQYAYFSGDIDEQFLGPLLDELDIHVFVDDEHIHDKVTGIWNTELFLMVGSTPKTWSPER